MRQPTKNGEKKESLEVDGNWGSNGAMEAQKIELELRPGIEQPTERRKHKMNGWELCWEKIALVMYI